MVRAQPCGRVLPSQKGMVRHAICLSRPVPMGSANHSVPLSPRFIEISLSSLSIPECSHSDVDYLLPIVGYTPPSLFATSPPPLPSYYHPCPTTTKNSSLSTHPHPSTTNPLTSCPPPPPAQCRPSPSHHQRSNPQTTHPSICFQATMKAQANQLPPPTATLEARNATGSCNRALLATLRNARYEISLTCCNAPFSDRMEADIPISTGSATESDLVSYSLHSARTHAALLTSPLLHL